MVQMVTDQNQQPRDQLQATVQNFANFLDLFDPRCARQAHQSFHQSHCQILI
jgi:hypothetical protein